ncbi:MAG: NAD(P)/FAD-dependent oxidoreductase [Candidatus Gygaella obscura]|nr:NAD(P)/FAD-dependent oxidoreductase [Candidatus Gygaella obscura]
MKFKIAVIGAGPAGVMSSIEASHNGCKVILIEKNPYVGKKLLLTGKGRGNLTNMDKLDKFLTHFNKNASFLRDAFKEFSNKDLCSFFTSRGLSLKTERQNRVFPVSDKAEDLVNVLNSSLKSKNIELVLNTKVSDILVKKSAIAGVVLESGKVIETDKVILATGGKSFPQTGSTGDGFIFASKLGHSVTKLKSGLVALVSNEKWVRSLQGLTLKNVTATFKQKNKKITSPVGEALFTHFGISGPLVLDISNRINSWLDSGLVSVNIDLKPGLNAQQLEDKFQRETKGKKEIKSFLKTLLPLRLVDVFIDRCNVSEHKSISQITKKERQNIVGLLKSLDFKVSSTLGLDKAMVTCGGVVLKEIDPRSMQSRLIKGLYFAGEIIDVDGISGGYNLQAAFSTGYLAGKSASI